MGTPVVLVFEVLPLGSVGVNRGPIAELLSTVSTIYGNRSSKLVDRLGVTEDFARVRYWSL